MPNKIGDISVGIHIDIHTGSCWSDPTDSR